MSVAAPLQVAAAKPQQSGLSIPSALLQRQCACGTSQSPLDDLRDDEKCPTLQKKLAMGVSNDPLEQEAERVAEHVLSPPGRSAMGGRAPRIERDTGQATRGAQPAPASVDRVLAGSGRPLEPGLEHDMGQRFGYDFSRVRVHVGSEAEQSARDVNAKAYTVGPAMVFGAGHFTPATPEGRRLIAHELTHVVQQRGAAGLVQRDLAVEDFEGGTFDLPVLQTYLSTHGPGKIEDNSDSDDKARTIVALWRKGKLKLDVNKKILLIQEMQSGFTGNDDERAILTLLLNSDADLQAIFAAGGGIDPKDLDSDFQGPEEDELRRFYDRQFEGGRAAALKGSRKLRGAKADNAKAVQEAKPPGGKAAAPAGTGPAATGDPTSTQDAANADTPAPSLPSCGEAIIWSPNSSVPHDINADNITEFVAKIDKVLGGSAHTNASFSIGADLEGGKMASVNLTVYSSIIRPRLSGGRPSATERALIKRVETFIKEHEERHRDITRDVAQKAVCEAKGKPVAQAKAIIKKAVCDTEPTQQEALDNKEGRLTWIKDNTGAVVDFGSTGEKHNYHDKTCNPFGDKPVAPGKAR